MICPSRLLSVLGASLVLGLGLLASPASAAVPAWQPVGATGPTVLPPRQSEVQRVFVDAEGGTFTLTARHLAAEGLGDMATAEGGVTNLITMNGAFASGQRLEGFGIRLGTNVNLAVGSSLFLSQNVDGAPDKQAYLVGYDAPATTAPLPYDASAAEVQAALEALAPVGAGNVEVSGGPGNHNAEHPYTVSFKGALADTDVGQLEPGSGALTGNATARTATLGGRGVSKLSLMAQNIGGVTSSGPITFRATLPSGITALALPTTAPNSAGADWSCGGSTAGEILCTNSSTVRPGLTAPPINAILTAAPGIEGGTVQIEVSGGGATATATEELPLTVSSTPAEPGFQSFAAGAYDENGAFDTRAGGHPSSASTAVFANTVRSPKGAIVPAGDVKDVTVSLPPGFLGNPIAVPECPESTPTQNCDLDTMVAVVEPMLEKFGIQGVPAGVFNTEAPFGYPAKFRFRVFESADLSVTGSLRSDGDYGIDAASLRTPQVDQLIGVFFTFWGEPASPAHDSVRCKGAVGDFEAIRDETGCEASGAANTALLTSATNCAEQALHPPVTPIVATLWQSPGEIFERTVDIPPVVGCENLEFEAGFGFLPSGSEADSPASFTTTLTVPDEGLTDPGKLITPEIKKSVVTLPEGVSLNPSGADGLGACSEQQIGLKGTGFPMPNPIRFDKQPNRCPDSSKIGTGVLKSALLSDPLHGDLYLAAQGDGNPFGSLFAIYLVIEDPRHGIFIKLPGKVEPDGQSGQITVTFDNLPQLPFTSLDLSLKGGDRSALASPPTCGNYTSRAVNTPWSAPESGPPLVSPSSFEIDRGPNGRPCAGSESQLPLDLGFDAGASKPLAGAHSPFTMRLTRPDGAQTLGAFELTAPEGFSATLRGIPYCSDSAIVAAAANGGGAERTAPSCPAASQIGTTTVGAGAGPRPFYVSGKVYLAGPYKGTQLSLAAIVPAVAGPFDLGTQVVRAALRVNPRTARLTAVTDQLPRILDGVPLRIRDIRVDIDRPDFALNPTDCSVQDVSARVAGVGGAVTNLSSRFQVGGCENLGFKPRLDLRLKGGTRRGAHPELRAVLRPRPGDANIDRAAVTLPRSAFLDQAHIRTICTRVQFAADACPPGAIYGRARAFTPLLDDPLEGPVYLRSSDNELPDLVADLRGQVDVEVVGRIDSVRGGIRNTFDVVPDAPVSKFVLRMQGGRKGLVVNSTDLCRGANRATVRLRAQNNRRYDFRPKVTAIGCRGQARDRRRR